MPILALTVVEQAAGLAALQSELRFMMEEKSVPLPVASVFGHLGLTDLLTLAIIETEGGKFRAM